MAFSPPKYGRLFAQKKVYQGGVTGKWKMVFTGHGNHLKFVSTGVTSSYFLVLLAMQVINICIYVL